MRSIESDTPTNQAEHHEAALHVLNQEPWTPTPLLQASTIGDKLGCELWLKREDCTPIGSFKLRGALVTTAKLGGELSDAGVYVASSGNYGLAIAFAGRRRGIPVTVFVPADTTPSKIDRITLEGARVVQHGSDFDEAKAFAKSSAQTEGAGFWEDGVVEEMAYGAATIGYELLEHPEPWDYVVVPLGNGSLIKGIASAFKAQQPEARVIGVVPASAPSMALSFRGERLDESATIHTHADGLAVRVPIPEIVDELKILVDDVWLVEEADLLRAVRTLL